MEGIQGMQFSIMDPQGCQTVIYRVNKTAKEFLSQYPKYTVERLVSAKEMNGDMTKKTFFIDEPDYEENLVILSFTDKKVIVNMGLLEGDEVHVSKTPMQLKFNTLYFEQEHDYKNFQYTPNLKRQISIIDPETTEEVKPKLYFDNTDGEVKAKCTLKPYKSYFAFEITDK